MPTSHKYEPNRQRHDYATILDMGVNLNENVHEVLKRNGYKFFLITAIKLGAVKGIESITVRAEKKTPVSLDNNFTGIDDPMITTFINGKGLGCEITVEFS